MTTLKVLSPCKLNLYLKVLRRRPDGYHDLATLFHRLSLSDTLILKKQKSGFFLKTNDPRLPADDRNIITKAYFALQRLFPRLGGVSVYLKKKIPMGAGLGGGSGNAAAFLKGMKRLYGLQVSISKLAKLGGSLGADVPFFIYNYNQALGIGRGDKIFPKPSKRKHWFLLAASKEGLSTKDVYETYRKFARPASLTRAKRAVTILTYFLEKASYDRIHTLLENDLEKAAFKLRPSLRKIISKFHALGVSAVRMTGSGPTVFGMVSSRNEASRIAKKLKRDLPNQQILICHSI